MDRPDAGSHGASTSTRTFSCCKCIHLIFISFNVEGVGDIVYECNLLKTRHVIDVGDTKIHVL